MSESVSEVRLKQFHTICVVMCTATSVRVKAVYIRVNSSYVMHTLKREFHSPVLRKSTQTISNNYNDKAVGLCTLYILGWSLKLAVPVHIVMSHYIGLIKVLFPSFRFHKRIFML